MSDTIKKPRGRPFQKGVSGNPSGKRKGCVSLTAAIKRSLTARNAQAIAQKCIDQAMAGDIAFLKLILDRTEGTVSSKFEMSGPQGGPIQTQATINLEKLTHDEILSLARIARRLAAETESDPEEGSGSEPQGIPDPSLADS